MTGSADSVEDDNQSTSSESWEFEDDTQSTASETSVKQVRHEPRYHDASKTTSFVLSSE